MNFKETREVVVTIPVARDGFYDNKEITELFNYVYDRSVLNVRSRFKNTFSIRYNNNGYLVCEFTISVNADDEHYDQRKFELKMLIFDYEIAEREYLRFRAFGQIESGRLIRSRK
jgi:hypothetical protein